VKYEQMNQQVAAGWALHAVGCALVLAVVGISYGFGFATFADQQEGHAARIEQLQALLHTAPEVHKLQQYQREELDKLTLMTTVMRRRLPNKMQKQEFEKAVERVAESVNLTTESTNWSTPKVEASHASVEITIRGTGSFASTCEFLNEISQLARITKISRLEVESAPDSSRYPIQITFALVYGVESHDTEEKGENQ
jgi:Tfp pilus assembly protein PilO